MKIILKTASKVYLKKDLLARVVYGLPKAANGQGFYLHAQTSLAIAIQGKGMRVGSSIHLISQDTPPLHNCKTFPFGLECRKTLFR